MNIKETLIDLGYEAAGVDLDNEYLNQVEALVGSDEDRDIIGAALKYVVLQDLKPHVVGLPFDPDANFYYSEHFWKLYPEVNNLI